MNPARGSGAATPACTGGIGANSTTGSSKLLGGMRSLRVEDTPRQQSRDALVSGTLTASIELKDGGTL
ncbi:hypothetical protein BDV93DRAFT_522787 [Ceratobasidium sp. AG-I]|nr:hypothetical protein BDV93DRAFT_522787 [Ceratobasidium sp. AG-I]